MKNEIQEKDRRIETLEQEKEKLINTLNEEPPQSQENDKISTLESQISSLKSEKEKRQI